MNFQKIKFNYDFVFCIIFSLICCKKEFIYYYIAYLFIFLHELSHLIVAILLKAKIRSLSFSLCGCCLELESDIFNNNIYIDIIIKLAGPLLNLVFLLLVENKYIYYINLILLLINIIPIMPLDGFYILRDILEMIFKNTYFVNKIIIAINNISIIIVFITGIIFCVKYYNISLLLFIVYVTIINMQMKNNYIILSKIKELV